MAPSLSSHTFIKTTLLSTPILRFVTFVLSDVDEDSVLPYRGEINVVQQHGFNYMKKCDKVVMKAVKDFFFFEKEKYQDTWQNTFYHLVLLSEKESLVPGSLDLFHHCSVSNLQSIRDGLSLSVSPQDD